MRLLLGLGVLAAYTHAFPHSSNSSLQGRDLASLSALRVVCVGDSITWGVEWDGSPYATPGQNGYRQDLYNLIDAAGWKPQFIGTQVSGTDDFPQKSHEGYPGNTIDQILAWLQSNQILNAGPNLVLIHAGTNDMDFGPSAFPSNDSRQAAQRLGVMIDYVLCTVPDAVVLVAQLIQNQNQGHIADDTANFNQQVPEIVGLRYMQGFKIRSVDMTQVAGSLMADLLHPNKQGYQAMADIWFDAMLDVPSSWWSDPKTSQYVQYKSVDVCDRNSISFVPLIGGGEVNSGFHANGDNAEPPSSTTQYYPKWEDLGITFLGVGWPGSGVHLVDLDGDGRTDWVWSNYTQGSEGEVKAFLNAGPKQWTPLNNGDLIAFGQPGTSYVEFADLNGDKRPELIYIANGKFVIYNNAGLNGNVIGWSELPVAEDQLNYIFVDSAPFHWFADFTGDGLSDLMVMNGNQVLDLYINQGPDGNGGFNWHQCLQVGIAGNGQAWADINGDGKADFISVGPDGGASGFFNNYNGGCSMNWQAIGAGTADSLAFNFGSDTIIFADMTGDGKADYNDIDSAGNVRTWQNEGYVGAANSAIGGWGAATRMGDADGDGRDDYFAVTSYSGIGVDLNAGQNGNSWNWNVVEGGTVIALGYPGASRHQVHLADINADGRDDYLVVDDATGAVHAYVNQGPTDTSWRWILAGELTSGFGFGGAGVTFADYDGDGRADYIHVNGDGTVNVWLNKGPDLTTWEPVNNGLIAAYNFGSSQANIHFADIDGDQKADYVYVNPDTGDTQVWFNTFDGTHVGWTGGNTLLAGQGYSAKAVTFGRISGPRHDLVAIDEGSGALKVWGNNCGNVVATTSAPVAGVCGTAPMATQTTSEAGYHPPLITDVPTICTRTDKNGEMVVYASGGSTDCHGPSRTVFAGGHLTINMEASHSAQVNYLTGTELFTSISSALASACTPPPSAGVTVSQCNPVSAIPSMYYAGDGYANRDASLAIALPYVRYSTENTRQALINAIAGMANVSSLAPKNREQSQDCANPTVNDDPSCIEFDYATIPGIIEAVYTKQDLQTNGRLHIENMEAQFALDKPDGLPGFSCSDAGLTSDGIGALGSIEALESLNLDTGASIAGPAIGLVCLILDATNQNSGSSSDPGPKYGDIVYPTQTAQPRPTFTDWPFTGTEGKDGGTTLFKSAVTTTPAASDASNGGIYPTDGPMLVLAVGHSVKVELASRKSVTIGTIHADALHTSISSILTEACPSPTGTTVTACASAAKITNVLYKEDPGNSRNTNYNTDGEIDILIPLVQYSTHKGWQALITNVARAFSKNAATSGNFKYFSGGECLHGSNDLGHCYGGNISQVGHSVQTFFSTQDESTNYTIQTELMQVRLELDKPGEGDPLVCDSLGFAFGFLGLFAAIPGLEFLAFIGPLVDIACAADSWA